MMNAWHRLSPAAKGLAFVVASALLLYAMTRHYLERAERTAEQLREAYEQTLVGWAAALDIRDHSTGGTPSASRSSRSRWDGAGYRSAA